MMNIIADIFKQNGESGQVWTPDNIAHRMAELAFKYFLHKPSIIIDPAVGPATFIKALYKCGLVGVSTRIIAYDIEQKYVDYSIKYLQRLGIEGHVVHNDYLLNTNKTKADLIIMNPPYIRHERIPIELKNKYRNSIGYDIDGRSNLYVYFLLKALRDLENQGILCAIVYDTIHYSKYGKKLWEIIKSELEILKTEKVETPFNNVLVNAIILVARKKKSRPQLSLNIPTSINPLPNQYTYLKELVSIQRGTGLLNTGVFMAKSEDDHFNYAKQFVKKTTKINGMIVQEDHSERAYLFEDSSSVPKSLQDKLQQKVEKIYSIKGRNQIKILYDAINRKPKRWFLHKIVRSKIIFNYYFREEPRFFLNPYELPIADNFYAIKPFNFDEECAWVLLNSSYYKQSLIKTSRPQGNGLWKIQVYEIKNAIVPDWRKLSKYKISLLTEVAKKCKTENLNKVSITKLADDFVNKYLLV